MCHKIQTINQRKSIEIESAFNKIEMNIELNVNFFFNRVPLVITKLDRELTMA